MITNEMKFMENYQLYVKVFEVDVPTTQSQPIESIQGTHRITSTSRTPNPEIAEGESSAPRRSTIIRLFIPPRRSTRLTPPTPIPTTDEADDLVLHDTLQVSLTGQKSHEELEATQNVEKVKEHLMAEEIEKLEPWSDKERPEVKKIADISQPVNVIEEESLRTHSTLISLDTEKLQELTKTDTIPSSSTPSSSSFKLSDTRIILEREKSQAEVSKIIADAIQQERENFRSEISSQVNDAITNHISSQVDSSVRNLLPLTLEIRTILIMMLIMRRRIVQKGKTNEHGMFELRGSSSGQDYESEPGPSTSGNQEQFDDFDFWTNSYATDDDVLLNEKVSQELVDEMSQTVDEAKLRKKGHTRPEKIALSLYKFPTVRFPDNDIEERTPRWVTKCVKKFNPYARYGVEHWKNSHAKIFYIKKQQEPGKPKEEVYLNSKIVQIIKTYWELRHEHKFITEIVARRANESIVSVTESDYKNLNKNDIEDMYLLIVNHKVDEYVETGLLWSLSVFIRSTVIWERVHDFHLGVESYQQQVNLTAPTITFPGIKKYKVFSIVSEPVYGIIYKNRKKEKRAMRHQEVHTS
ncbi:hypothetical protein Tco_0420806 [Tanacetum coccineum]